MTHLQRALAEWRVAIRSEYVITTPEALSIAQTATFKTTQQIPAVIRPGNRREVQECLRIANRFKTPVYPISTGKNWGYGSKVPVSTGCVLMELGRLNRIVDFDDTLGYVTIEPGVTFRRLNDFLRRKKSSLVIAPTGSTGDSSIIGNTVERGVGLGPHGDRFAHVSGLEVVLPTGQCIRTGFDSFPRAKAGKVARWGIGPHLNGLFTQSNFGVITQMTLWLAPVTQLYSCRFRLNADRSLGDLIDILQRLSMHRLLPCTFSMWNVYRTLSLSGQYPWKQVKGRTPLPAAVVRTAQRQFGAWNGHVWLDSLSGDHARAQRELIRSAIGTTVDTLVFERSPRPSLESTDRNISQTHWRKRAPPPKKPDPDRDACGVIWCSPAIPFRGKDVITVLRLLYRIMKSFHFEPNVGLLFVSERLIYVTASILFDRDEPGEDDRALKCYQQLFRELTNRGYFPYRLGIQSMSALRLSHEHSRRLLTDIKDVLDPNHILAPGRYEHRYLK